MKEKYFKMTAYLLVALLVLGVIYYFISGNKQKVLDAQDSMGGVIWEYIDGWGVSYPSNWVVVADRYQSPGQQAAGLPADITGYTFTLPEGATFSIGGHQPMSCADNKFVDKVLVYGVTTSFCFKDQAIKISSQSTQDDKNAFGDFILKNSPGTTVSDLQVEKLDTEVVVNEIPEQKLKFCPDIKINNMFPVGIDPDYPEENPIPSEYYIFQEERYELYEFDSTWLETNCDIKEETVY